jgi:uncharacterized protein
MKMLKSMGSFILTIAGIYLVILLLMYLFQNQLLFMPSSAIFQTPQQAGLSAEDVWIETTDGVRLHGWYFPNEASEWVVVLSHGNAGNISGRIAIAETLLRSGAAVLMYDYRGYGKSNGKPSEHGLYKDIEGVVCFLTDEFNYPEHRIVMYGRSLGGAVAAYAATRFSLGGLVLDSAFINMKRMVREVYPFVPAFLATYDFPTDRYISELQNTPVMIMHSPNDEIISYHHGKYLFERATEPKQFIQLRGGHNDNFFLSREIIEQSWINFLHEANAETETGGLENL